LVKETAKEKHSRRGSILDILGREFGPCEIAMQLIPYSRILTISHLEDLFPRYLSLPCILTNPRNAPEFRTFTTVDSRITLVWAHRRPSVRSKQPSWHHQPAPLRLGFGKCYELVVLSQSLGTSHDVDDTRPEFMKFLLHVQDKQD
jgi:hypothetical protein